MNLGVIYTGLNRLDEAEQSYERAVELKPDSAEAHYNLGVFYELHRKDLPRALAQYHKYLDLGGHDDRVETDRRVGWAVSKRNVREGRDLREMSPWIAERRFGPVSLVARVPLVSPTSKARAASKVPSRSRPPIGAWTHIGADAGGHVFRSGPNLHMLDVDDGIGIVRFIQWQRDGAGDLAGHGDSGPWWEGRGIKEFSLEGDKAAL